ncbi:hypothetical protein ACP4OV_011884 [Aristida adscensionis]
MAKRKRENAAAAAPGAEEEAAAAAGRADAAASPVQGIPDGKKSNLRNKEEQSMSAVSNAGPVAIDKDVADESVSYPVAAKEISDGKKPNMKNKEYQSPSTVSDTGAVAMHKDVADDSASDAVAAEGTSKGEGQKLMKRKESKGQQSRADAGYVAMAKDVIDNGRDTSGSGCKKSNEKKRKTAQVTVSGARLVDDMINACGDGSIGKVHGGIRPGLFQDEAQKVRDIRLPRVSSPRVRRKKLLILDINGVLADINKDWHNSHRAHAKIRGQSGIWSSRLRQNVDAVIDLLLKDLKQNLLFSWDASKCTDTQYNTPGFKRKPLVLKEMYKLWNKEGADLPWDKGEYSPSNTLLIDDSPYKALRNPPYTAIFPYPYSYKNKRDDSLGRYGDLRLYLKKLATADDVQRYVKEHPFGQPAITKSDPDWSFYVRIVDG